MKLNSRAVALILATCVGLLTGSFLSLIEDLPIEGMIVGISIAFSSTFLLSYFILEFLFFREIQNIYKVLNSVKGNTLKKQQEIPSFQKEVNPFKRINAEIEEFASSKEEEIEYLKQLGKFRREFLADVSHELKTPVFAAQGFIYTLLDGAVDDKNVRHKFLKKAAKSLDGLDRLVADLITVSQMESGEITMDMETFDVRGLAYEIKDQFSNKAQKRSANIEVRYDPKTPIYVKADRQRIGQVFTNLIDNSIKYGKPEGGNILISFQVGNVFTEVRVEDDGPGISPEHLNRVFERFYMADKSRAKKEGKKGSGLGLAIVKHIIEGHDSSVEVNSKLGVGTVFTFRLKTSLRDKKEEFNVEGEN